MYVTNNYSNNAIILDIYHLAPHNLHRCLRALLRGLPVDKAESHVEVVIEQPPYSNNYVDMLYTLTLIFRIFSQTTWTPLTYS